MFVFAYFLQINVCVSKEKHRQALLVMMQTQELLSERDSRRRLESEVEALCSQERELKDKAEKLKAALYKVPGGLLVEQPIISIQQY